MRGPALLLPRTVDGTVKSAGFQVDSPRLQSHFYHYQVYMALDMFCNLLWPYIQIKLVTGSQAGWGGAGILGTLSG